MYIIPEDFEILRTKEMLIFQVQSRSSLRKCTAMHCERPLQMTSRIRSSPIVMTILTTEYIHALSIYESISTSGNRDYAGTTLSGKA